MSELVTLDYSQGGGTVPFRVRLAPGLDLQIQSVTASWDGAGASGSFLPCLAMYSQDGVLLSRTFPQGVTLTTADTAVVTYAPFLDAGSGGGSGTSGIFFDTDNEGGYLEINANDPGPSGRGMRLADNTDEGMLIFSEGGSPSIRLDGNGPTLDIGGATAGIFADPQGNFDIFLIALQSFRVLDSGSVPVFQVDEDGTITFTGTVALADLTGAPDASANLAAGGVFLVNDSGAVALLSVQEDGSEVQAKLAASGVFRVTDATASDLLKAQDGGDIDLHSPAGDIHIQAAGEIQLREDPGGAAVVTVTAVGELGFFGAGPSTQVATPVTLADVIALLQAYGLAA